MRDVARTLIKQERRAAGECELADKIRALPDKRYGVIYADPPWRFEPYSRVTGMDRAAESHYPTSPLAEIKALDVESIAAADCVLFLWATAPMLPQAIEVMEAWGFTYKSCAVWSKDRIGTGYWYRNKHEILLVGTRGHVPAPAMGFGSCNAMRSSALSLRAAHSAWRISADAGASRPQTSQPGRDTTPLACSSIFGRVGK
jgi:hypothetical protein